jgi:7-cyano-7-deazaguanine synthase in queuosine biosynthesis
LWIDYGQKAAQCELDSVRYFADKYGVVFSTLKIPDTLFSTSALTDWSQTANDVRKNVVEGRNLLFIALAAVHTSRWNMDAVSVGFHAEPVSAPFPDATEVFADAVERAIAAGYVNPPRLLRPFKDMERRDIFKWALARDPEIVHKAHTCYENVPGGCGLCTHCMTKASILKDLEA